MPNITNITPPRVPLTDPRTGLISREWYRFFLNLFVLTGSGSNDVSIQDILVGPPSMSAESFAQINAIYNQALSQPSNFSSELQAQIDSLSQFVYTQPRAELGTMAALQQANLPWVTFDTTPQSVPTGAAAAGTLYWNTDDNSKTLNLIMEDTGGVVQQIGEETYYRVKASSTISDGQVVMFDGTLGASGGLKAKPATGLTAFQNEYIMGVATQNIATNGWGYITWFGEVKGINTTGSLYGETWADGDILYYNPAVAGGLTKTVPIAPNPKVIVASVVHAATNGILFVRPTFGSALGATDSNVQITSLSNNDILQYVSANSRWENKAVSSIIVGTATNLAGGSANQIPYQTGANTTSFITAPTVSDTYLKWSGSAFQWATNPLGTVTSVDVSGGSTGLTFSGGPITTSGTITMAGTLSVGYGGTGQTSYTNGQLLIGNTTGNTLTKATLTAGAGVSITNGAGSITIAATGSGGTVTSVDVSGGSTGLTFSGGPVTTSGTITMAGLLGPTYGGTGVNNGAKTITLGGSLTTSGAFNSTFTMTNTTSVTFPTTGTLATTSNKLSDFASTTSAELASVISDETGTAGNLVFSTSPTLTTPRVIGSSTGYTTIASANASATNYTMTLPAATDTFVGKATTDTLTNKTYDTAGTGNVFKINGTQVSAVTGTGSTAVLSTSPTISTGATLSVSSGYSTLYFNFGDSITVRGGKINKNYDSPYDMGIYASNASGTVPFAIYSDLTTLSMYVDTGGRVGFGTSTPNTSNDVTFGKLGRLLASPAITTSSGFLQVDNASGNFYLGIDNSTGTTFGFGNYSRVLYTGNAYPVVVATSGLERARFGSAGNFYYFQAAPTTKNAAATLSQAEVLAGILSYTGAAATVTLPTGTTLDTSSDFGTNMAINWSVINTGSGTCTIAVNTGITSLGALTVAAGASGLFSIRKTAANTFVLYRLS